MKKTLFVVLLIASICLAGCREKTIDDNKDTEPVASESILETAANQSDVEETMEYATSAGEKKAETNENGVTVNENEKVEETTVPQKSNAEKNVPSTNNVTMPQLDMEDLGELG